MRGLAAMLFAPQTIHHARIRHLGDVAYGADTAEESSGAGSAACVAREIAADAGSCAGLTEVSIRKRRRGALSPTIRP